MDGWEVEPSTLRLPKRGGRGGRTGVEEKWKGALIKYQRIRGFGFRNQPNLAKARETPVPIVFVITCACPVCDLRGSLPNTPFSNLDPIILLSFGFPNHFHSPLRQLNFKNKTFENKLS